MEPFLDFSWSFDVSAQVRRVRSDSMIAEIVVDDLEVVIYRLVRQTPPQEPVYVILQEPEISFISVLEGQGFQFRDNLIRSPSVIVLVAKLF